MGIYKTAIGMGSLLLGLTLALSSCAAEKDPVSEPDATEDLASTPTAQPSDSDSEAEAKVIQEPEADKTDTPTSVNPSDCIVGTWLTDNSFFKAGIESYGDIEVLSVSGEVYDTFHADGKRTTEYQDWEWTATTQGETMTFQRSGSDQGSWKATDNTITVSDLEMRSVITILGPATITLQPEPDHLENAPYTCEGDTATLTAHGHTHPLYRQ